MTNPQQNEISIARAAAFDNSIFFTLPANVPISADTQGPDPMSNVLLRLATTLLADTPPANRQSTGIILGTPHGCIQADWEFDRSRREAAGRYASPAAFSRTLPSTLPAELSVKLGLQGPLLTLCAGNASTAVAIRRAVSWMHHLKFHHCLTGGLDAGTNPTAQPRAALLLLSTTADSAIAKIQTTPPTPFDASSPVDDSLVRLIAAIQSPHVPSKSIALGAGVYLLRN